MEKYITISALEGAGMVFWNTIRWKNPVWKHCSAIAFLFLIFFLPQVTVADSKVPSDPAMDQTSFEDMGSGFLPGDDHRELFRQMVDTETPREGIFTDITSQLKDSDLDIAWTFLFYDDAEFDGFDPLELFCSDAYSSDNIKVIVLQDDEDGPATLWYVHEDSYPVFLENWREVNMGDWETLYDFIMWGKTNYPADRYILTLYDHGGGWMGACWDYTSYGDYLRMDEIDYAISRTGGVDIIAFTAPCLMGALESAYELRDCVEVYIGSEDLSGFVFWWDIIDDICDILNDSSALSNAEIGSMIIDLVEVNAPLQSIEWLTMSAVEQASIQNITDPLDELVVYMIENMSELGPNIQTARQNAWAMGMGSYSGFEIDLYDYLLQITEIETDPFVLDKALEIRQAFIPAIINECHGSSQTRAHGLSIYFPPDAWSFNPNYGLVDLDFADNTQWNEFLEVYHDWQQTGIAGGSAFSNPGIHVNPNPFSNTTQVAYTCTSSEIVDLTVFDISGRTIRTLAYGMIESGTHNISWDGRNNLGNLVPAGVYICVLKTENGSMGSAMVILVR